MAFLMARFEVDDYEAWKNRFDADPAGRRDTAKGHRVFRNTKNANEVIVILEFESPDAARAFRQRLDETGVLETVRLAAEPAIVEEVEAVTY